MSVFQADTQDSDLATAQTIRAMCEHIHRASKDPVVRAIAMEAETKMRMGAAGSGCFWWAKHFVKQLPHSQFKALFAPFPQKRQLLVAPEVVVRAKNPAGDCSTFSMLIAAMLESLGIRWELVTVAVEPSAPWLYSHVFVRAVSADGIRLTLDGSHGKSPGSEVPRARQLRRQVWDENGNAISDAAVVSELGEYRPMPGLGQDDDSGGTYTDSSSLPGALPSDTSVTTLTNVGPTNPLIGNDAGTTAGGAIIPAGYYSPDGGLTIIALPSNAITVPSQSSASWPAAVAAMTKAGLTLAEINTIQPGTVVGANGQILRQATGLPVPVGSGVTAALGSSSTTLLLLGGAALLVMFMVMGNKR
jgi:hypothetical protein